MCDVYCASGCVEGVLRAGVCDVICVASWRRSKHYQIEVTTDNNTAGRIGQNIELIQAVFEEAKSSSLTLVGKTKTKTDQDHQSIFNPDWRFEHMGIGGLDKEFADIFMNVLATHVLPLEIIEQMGLKHVKGLLLYGPPGCGKSLMATEIGKMLNAKKLTIVNSYKILSNHKQTTAQIHKMFSSAKEEYRRMGANSGLHVIILDKIDGFNRQSSKNALCQLLSKMDEVDQLNNILVIGLTTWPGLIDDALVRPGRLEVQVEIGLPDEEGREQILLIETATMRNLNRLASDVNFQELARETEGYSGMDLNNMVSDALDNAICRHIQTNSTEELQVMLEDFL